MLLGEYETNIGDKNRIALPKKLREELNGRIYLTRGYENCLILVDHSRWEALLKEVNKHPLLSLNVRDTKRYILGGAVEIEPDAQGRFVLPIALKQFAKLETEIVFLGLGEWVEIWDRANWINKLFDLAQNVADIAERLSQLNEARE